MSFVEHSVVEYAGRADDDDNIYDDANIYLANAKPTIQYNTIRNSRSSGIYATGTGCNGATLNCNNLKDNVYGIYTAGNASPLIQNNNFLRNQTSGLYNESSISLNAENNWWGDAAGPNNSGDHISGNADHDPWLTEESGCISTPPTNSPPFAPTDPAPADSAIRVPVTDGGQPADVALTWTGRDPNPWDTLVFDVFFGDAEDNLQKAAESIPDAVHVMSGLAEGATYYWQIMIRDDSGEETAGPVWHFTTLGNPPDLLAEAVTWSPESGIIPGQEVTFTAVIRNIGTGPVVDSFQADFKIDGSVIKTVPVSTVIHVGESVQVSSAWSARAGIHTVGVVADSASEVVETSEDNNSLTVSLPDIIDDKPPALVSTAPADGASVQEVRQIVITLSDGYGTVDDTAVTGSIIVLDSSNQPVAGTISEAGDVFTFVPAASPLENGTYTVSLTGADTAGNTQDFSFSFTTDSLAPAGLSITGGSVTSGVIRVLPFQNLSDNPAITLTGTREDNTSVWINNVRKADSGTGDWSVSLSLPQGEISLEIWLEDIAGNRSPSELVDILTDSVAPSVISVTPSDGSFLNTVPAAVTAEILEEGTGLNTGSTSLSVKDSSQAEIPGDWTFSGTGLIFTPAGAFSDSVYTVDIQLEDNFGNRGALLQNSFTVDTVRPPDPGYDPVVSPTYNPTQIITGTKEAFAAILLDSEVIAGHTSGTTWEYTAALNEGENLFVLTAQDRAGNLSETVTFSIVYDDSPPPPVNTLTADGQGDGTVVVLNWGGYDESVRRPVASYRIYAETSDFTDVSALTEHGTADAGTFSFAAENLDRNTTYWFAVTAADSTGRADTSVTTVSAAAEDTVGPEDITGLLARCFADRLEFSWNHSADTHGDLAGYRVWFGNETEGTELLPEQNTFEKTGLDSAAGYLFRIAAFDNDENESNEVFVTGITLLPDPENLSAAAYNGYAELVWDYAGPPEYLRHFAVYVSETEFSDVSDMTPLLTASENSAKIENLANGVTYWFAVTAVNESGCEQKQVTPVSATLQSDTDGPEITDVMAGDSELENGHILFKTKTITLNTADISGTDRVEFYLNDTLICTDSTGTPGYSCEADITGFEYGDYTFEIRAYDSPGNMSSVEYTVSVIPLPPYECFQSCIEEDSQLLAPKLRFGNALTGKAPGLPVQEAGTN
ncbi:MAG: hypothetical protein GY758_10050 [Fuerstiella sp.]|nr:hypothetical protein [Fuerstiella sp.]